MANKSVVVPLLPKVCGDVLWGSYQLSRPDYLWCAVGLRSTRPLRGHNAPGRGEVATTDRPSLRCLLVDVGLDNLRSNIPCSVYSGFILNACYRALYNVSKTE